MDAHRDVVRGEACRLLFDTISEYMVFGRLLFDEQSRPIDYVITEVNEAYARYTGFKKSIAAGMSANAVGALAEQDLLERLGAVVSTGKCARFETFDTARDRWFDVQAVSLREESCFGILAVDITAPKRDEHVREQLLGALDAQLGAQRALMAALPVGVWVADADGKIIMVNNAAAEIYGGTAPVADSVEEYAVYKLYWPEKGERVLPRSYPLARALRGELVKDIVFDFERFDGTQGTQIASAAPISDANGAIIGGVAVAMDITRLRQAGTALKESEQKALALVKELEETDRNKNHFISILAHELRNPLASITAGLSLLELAESKEQEQETRDIIKREAHQLQRLVDDLMDITRITLNKMKIKKENVTLNQIIKDAANNIKLEFRKKGVHLWVKIHTKPLQVFADPVRITQAVGNLLNNALKFTHEGGSVWLSLEKEKRSAVISVRDNGIGIKPELAEQLFKPFIQADETADRQNGGGLGLGLSVVKGIVELHGGVISADSQGLGKGALFVLSLPLGAGAPGFEK